MFSPTRRYHYIEQPEPIYSINTNANVDFDTDVFRYKYSSLTTPSSVLVYDMNTRVATVKKEQKVLGGYDKALYKTGATPSSPTATTTATTFTTTTTTTTTTLTCC